MQLVWRPTCPKIHESKQFICLTYHLSDKLKTGHKFFHTGFICATYIPRAITFLCFVHTESENEQQRVVTSSNHQ